MVRARRVENERNEPEMTTMLSIVAAVPSLAAVVAPPPPPDQPVVDFHFDEPQSLHQPVPPGWSNVGMHPWRRASASMHGLANRKTGPGGSVFGHGGYWYFAGGRGELDRTFPGHTAEYVLEYAGRECHTEFGGIVGHVSFYYHMWVAAADSLTAQRLPLTMGTLELKAVGGQHAGSHDDATVLIWARAGNQGDEWRHARVEVMSRGVQFEYTRGGGLADAAIAEVTVECALASPSPPPSPPVPPPAPPTSPAPPRPPPSPPAPPCPPPPAYPPRPPLIQESDRPAWVGTLIFFVVILSCVMVTRDFMVRP